MKAVAKPAQVLFLRAFAMGGMRRIFKPSLKKRSNTNREEIMGFVFFVAIVWCIITYSALRLGFEEAERNHPRHEIAVNWVGLLLAPIFLLLFTVNTILETIQKLWQWAFWPLVGKFQILRVVIETTKGD